MCLTSELLLHPSFAAVTIKDVPQKLFATHFCLLLLQRMDWDQKIRGVRNRVKRWLVWLRMRKKRAPQWLRRAGWQFVCAGGEWEDENQVAEPLKKLPCIVVGCEDCEKGEQPSISIVHLLLHAEGTSTWLEREFMCVLGGRGSFCTRSAPCLGYSWPHSRPRWAAAAALALTDLQATRDLFTWWSQTADDQTPGRGHDWGCSVPALITEEQRVDSYLLFMGNRKRIFFILYLYVFECHDINFKKKVKWCQGSPLALRSVERALHQ